MKNLPESQSSSTHSILYPLATRKVIGRSIGSERLPSRRTSVMNDTIRSTRKNGNIGQESLVARKRRSGVDSAGSNTYKKKDDSVRSKEENKRREDRAVRLFDYIELCSRAEKEENRQVSALFATKQRVTLIEKTKQLEIKRDLEIQSIKEKKHNIWIEKKERLVEIGRKKNQTQIGSQHDATSSDTEHLGAAKEESEPKVFMSKFYEQQANQIKFSRVEYQARQQSVRDKRHELFKTFSAKRYIEGEELESVSPENNPDTQVTKVDELERIIEKYTRPDSPASLKSTVVVQATKKFLNESKQSRMTLMLESIKKNKLKTSKMTSGGINASGAISSISYNFEATKLHGKSMNDPLWTVNLPEPAEIMQFRDPIEFVLSSKRKDGLPPKVEPIIDSAEIFDEMDVEESPALKEVIVQKVGVFRSADDEELLKETSSMISRVSRSAHYHSPFPKSSLADRFKKIMVLERNDKNVSNESIDNFEDIPLKSSFESNEIPKIKKRPSIIRQTINAILPQTKQILIAKEKSISIAPQKDRTLSLNTLNPFSGTISRSQPDAEMPQSLADWHRQVKANEISIEMSNWPAISLEAVAEFGKTRFSTKAKKNMAMAAENEMDIARPKKYQSSINPFLRRQHSNAEAVESPSKTSFFENPIKGSKFKFWPTIEHEG